MLEIKVKYLDEQPQLEFICGDKSNWIDLRAAEDVKMEQFDYKLIALGVAMELPKGYEAIVAPRSSTFKKYGIIMSNGIGIIDESYCGDNDEWHFPAVALRPTIIHKGDRICQFRIIEHMPSVSIRETDRLGNANRGGIGSTG